MELLPHNHAVVEELRLRHRIWTPTRQPPQPWSSPRAPETLAHLHPWRPLSFTSTHGDPSLSPPPMATLLREISSLLPNNKNRNKSLFSTRLPSSSGCLCEGVQFGSPCFLPRKVTTSPPLCSSLSLENKSGSRIMYSWVSPPRRRPAPDVAKMGKNDPDAHPFSSGDRSPLQDVTNSPLSENAESSYATQKKSSLSWYDKLSDEKRADILEKRRVARQ